MPERSYAQQQCSTVTVTTPLAVAFTPGVVPGNAYAGPVIFTATIGSSGTVQFDINMMLNLMSVAGNIQVTLSGPGGFTYNQVMTGGGIANFNYISGSLPAGTYTLMFALMPGSAGTMSFMSSTPAINATGQSSQVVCGGDHYRYGFNGMEKDNEVKGVGNSLDFGARIYDSRLGRWLSTDPLEKRYPDVSPYSFAANSPLFFKDPDGNEVRAYGAEAQDMVIRTLTYAFGSGHGFTFINNKLIHNGEVPKNMTPQQELMFTYFNDVLVKSRTVTTLLYNEISVTHTYADGETRKAKVPDYDGAITYYYPESREYVLGDGRSIASISHSVAGVNYIILPPQLILNNGILLGVEGGRDAKFPIEHSTLHEFGHAIVNTIMNELRGNFNGVDFNSMTEEQRHDWSIQYTNTLLESMKKTLETGKGQHDRPDDGLPANKPGPLKK